MVLPLKGDLIDCPITVIDTFFLLVQGCSKIGKVAQGLVPLLLGALGSCLLPLLPLLLSRAGEGEPALRSLLSFLFRLLAHEHLIFLACASVEVLLRHPILLGLTGIAS